MPTTSAPRWLSVRAVSDPIKPADPVTITVVMQPQ
jgi:hypothetical protein